MRLPTTLTVSSRTVNADGEMEALYINMNTEPSRLTTVTMLRDDVWAMYRVGGFDLNFARGVLLMFCQLAFLAGLGVLAGTFLSFPVACLLCFAMLPFCIAREFLTSSVKLARGGVAESETMTIVGHVILRIVGVLLPDFARTSPADSLVDGMYIGWGSLAGTVALVVFVQTAVALAIACLIFHKRELARVQV